MQEENKRNRNKDNKYIFKKTQDNTFNILYWDSIHINWQLCTYI